MDIEALIRRYPNLYHMAERGSWPSIQKLGLLSTTATMDLMKVQETARNKYERMHRPTKMTVAHPRHGRIVLRDQKPMSDVRLATCLQDGLQPGDWYALLNGKVFFWVTEARLHKLLNARAYRSEEHDVLTIDTGPLVRKYAARVLLTHMNTGNTFPMPHKRGLNTFKTIPAYPTKADGKTPLPEVVELVVENAVRDIAQYVLAVRRMCGSSVLSQIYAR